MNHSAVVGTALHRENTQEGVVGSKERISVFRGVFGHYGPGEVCWSERREQLKCLDIFGFLCCIYGVSSVHFIPLDYLLPSTLARRAKETDDGDMRRAAQNPPEHLNSDLTLSCDLHLPLHPLSGWGLPSPNPARPGLFSPC